MSERCDYCRDDVETSEYCSEPSCCYAACTQCVNNEFSDCPVCHRQVCRGCILDRLHPFVRHGVRCRHCSITCQSCRHEFAIDTRFFKCIDCLHHFCRRCKEEREDGGCGCVPLECVRCGVSVDIRQKIRLGNSTLVCSRCEAIAGCGGFSALIDTEDNLYFWSTTLHRVFPQLQRNEIFGILASQGT